MEITEPKNCPFCAGKARIKRYKDGGGEILCSDKCSTSMKYPSIVFGDGVMTEDEAIEMWNDRVAPIPGMKVSKCPKCGSIALITYNPIIEEGRIECSKHCLNSPVVKWKNETEGILEWNNKSNIYEITEMELYDIKDALCKVNDRLLEMSNILHKITENEIIINDIFLNVRDRGKKL